MTAEPHHRGSFLAVDPWSPRSSLLIVESVRDPSDVNLHVPARPRWFTVHCSCDMSQGDKIAVGSYGESLFPAWHAMTMCALCLAASSDGEVPLEAGTAGSELMGQQGRCFHIVLRSALRGLTVQKRPLWSADYCSRECPMALSPVRTAGRRLGRASSRNLSMTVEISGGVKPGFDSDAHGH